MFNIYIAAFLGGLVGLVIGLLLGHCLRKQNDPLDVADHKLIAGRSKFTNAADRYKENTDGSD